MTLRTYIITRILLTIPMVLLLLTIVFTILRVLPGDPVLLHFEKRADPQVVAEFRHKLGLDKPIWAQYFDYISGLIRLDLGKSMQDFSPVSQQIFSAFPATLELAIFSMIIAVGIGIVLGVESASSYNTLKDHSIRIFGVTTYAIPVFFLGIIFQMIFGIMLGWLPTGGRTYPGMEPVGAYINLPKIEFTLPIIGTIRIGGPTHLATGLYTVDSILEGNFMKFIAALRYLCLPSLTLGLVLSGIFIRLTRNNMIETLRMDFITAAKARGLKERVIVYSYALKNSFLPILTMMGLQFATLLSGAVLTETTFSWPGLGRYIFTRIGFRDYTALQGAITVYAILVALVSLIVDVLYAYLDPRIRL